MSGEVMWYYQFEDERAGPVTEDKIIELIASGVVRRDTLVWRQGMSDWQEAYMTELARCFVVEAPGGFSDSTQGGGARDYLVSRVGLQQKLRLWYLIFGIALCSSVFLAALGPLAWIAALVSTFFGLLIMYHVWSVIPQQKRLLSPFTTVLLMIIPLFNMFWIFYCYYGAARRINKELEEKGITDFRVNEYLVLGYAVSTLLLTVFFAVTMVSGVVLASLNLFLIVIPVFLQVFMMRAFIVAVIRLIRS